MTDIITDSFKTVLITLQYVGLYQHDHQNIVIKIWSLSLYFLCVLVTTLAFVGFVKQRPNDFMQTNQMVVYLSASTAMCLKLLLLSMKRRSVKKCIEYFKDRRFAPTDDHEKVIMDDCVRVCKRNAKIFRYVLLCADISWTSLPFFEKELRLPINLWLPYELTKTPAIFYSTYLCTFIVLLYCGVIVATLEPLLGGLSYHATCQVKILKYNLSNLDKHKSVNGFDSFTVSYTDLLKALKKCVIRHNSILEFIADYENCFSLCTLCQVAGTTVALGFCCIGLTLVPPTSVSGILFVSSYLVVSSQLFFHCHYGTLLHEENEKLLNALYMNPWYEYDTRLTKMLLMVMERTKSPVTLTAGSIIDLTYQTFISVLKTSYSLVAVINNFN